MPIYPVNDLQFHSTKLMLYRGETPLDVPVKVLEVLLVFLKHPGEVISREMLRSQAWAGTHVSDGNLTNIIHLLRAMLRDEAGMPDAIHTYSKRGYCYVPRYVPELVQIPDCMGGAGVV